MYVRTVLTTLGTGKHLNLRQRIISTAIVYFKRFYLDQSFIEFDPYLVSITMLFLSAKASMLACCMYEAACWKADRMASRRRNAAFMPM